MINLNARVQNWFRQAAPYISSHKNECMIIVLESKILDLPNAQNIFADLALLNTLGIKLVILLDIDFELKTSLSAVNSLQLIDNKILLDKNNLHIFLNISQIAQRKLEAAFSLGMQVSSSYTPHIKLISGNLVSAMPLGVQNGVDFSLLGKVRKIDATNINAILDLDFGVFLPPWGYSVTSEVFGLEIQDLVLSVAKSLQASKVIFLSSQFNLADQQMTSGVSPLLVDQFIATNQAKLSDLEKNYLTIAAKACRIGVKRVHILNANLDGALLQELFSPLGVGTMVTQQAYETLRKASLKDISSLLNLLKPLVEAGILIARDKNWLEADINNFSLLDLDGSIIACVALYPYLEDSMAELACLAVDDNYRNQQKAVLLLQNLEKDAKNLGVKKIFVLTTQTSHWFLANGFKSASLEDLPKAKQLKYNFNRGSKIFIKDIF